VAVVVGAVRNCRGCQHYRDIGASRKSGPPNQIA
jgi:hypothetical protein